MKLKLFLALILLLCCVGVADAAILYICDDGTCPYSCDGLDDQVEIQWAIDNATAGDTVHMNASTICTISASIEINKSDFIFEGEGDTSVIQCTNATTPIWIPYIGASNLDDWSLHPDLTNLTLRNFKINSTYASSANRTIIVYDVDGFTISSVKDETVNTEGWSICPGGTITSQIPCAKNATIKNGYIENGHIGFSYTNNITVKNNTIVNGIGLAQIIDINRNNNYVYIYDNNVDSGSTARDAITLYTSNYIYVRNNTFTDGRSCIFLSNQPKHAIVENNTCRNFAYYGIWIKILGDMINDTIRNNVIYDINGGAGGRGHGIYTDQHVGTPAFSWVNISNNVFYDLEGDGVYHRQTSLNLTVKNNIFAEVDGYGVNHTAGNLTFEYNDIWNATKGNYNLISAEIFEGSNNISVDPLFYDAENGKFYLNSTAGTWNGTGWEIMSVDSPCIDNGSTSDDYTNEPYPHGQRINIGAYGNTIYASKSPYHLIYLNKPVIIYPNATRSYLEPPITYYGNTTLDANFSVVPETAEVNITVTTWNPPSTVVLVANSTTSPNNVTFTVCNVLTAGETYNIRKDGAGWKSLTANASGCIVFNNSQWSEITFTIELVEYCFVWYNGTNTCTGNFTATLDNYATGDYYAIKPLIDINSSIKRFNETSNNASIQVNVTVCGLDASSQYKVSIYNWTTNNKVTEKVVKTNSTGCLSYLTTNITVRYVIVEKQSSTETSWFMVYGAIGGLVISGVYYWYRRWRKV